MLRAYEIASLIGALLGFIGCGWPLLWASSTVPLYRRNVSTSASGGGGYLATAAAALLGATVLVRLADGAAWLVGWLQARRRLAACTPTAVELSASRIHAQGGTECSDGVNQAKRSQDIHDSGASGDELHAASCGAPIASLHRPCFERLIGATLAAHPGARLVGAGPESMLSAIDSSTSKLRMKEKPPLIRLTHSM